jgi:serine/threonine protein kinase
MNHEIKRIGTYELLRELARGSFGRVYLARHAVLTNRIVAIKLMLSAPLSSAEKQESFLQEARFLEMLKHPHILPIIDVSFHEDIPYLVTEYEASGSLRDRLNQRLPDVFPLEESLGVLFQIGQALQYAHQQHIIHRDLKPENILFNAQGNALLTDFGISTMLSTASIKNVDNDGTPAYMAPEQFRGTISKESDQYALGCIAYELFTGHPPFSAPDFFALGFKHLMEPPLAPTIFNPQLPAHISQAVLKALAKERTNRFPDVRAFIEALQIPPRSQEATGTPSETDILTLPSSFQRAAARDLTPGPAPTAPTPFSQQEEEQKRATLLPSDTRSPSTLLAQTTPSGFSHRVERQQVTAPGKQEALSAFEPNQQSQTPFPQYPVTPFPPTMQVITPLPGKGGQSGEHLRRRIVLIVLAASLVLVVSLGSVLFLVLPSAFSSSNAPTGTSTQPSSTTSQTPNRTQTSKPTTSAPLTHQTAISGSGHGATATPQATGTSAGAPRPTATTIPTPTPTTAPTPTPTPTPLSETVTVPFTAGTPGVSTQNSFSGTVQVAVSGTGHAASTKWSDAFYIYTDSSGNPLNPPNHASCWVMYINGQPTDAFVSTPSYQDSHSYTFTMTAPGGPLSFGICDGITSDNNGSYTVTVTQE